VPAVLAFLEITADLLPAFKTAEAAFAAERRNGGIPASTGGRALSVHSASPNLLRSDHTEAVFDEARACGDLRAHARSSRTDLMQ
jgi:hypothetical protein